MGRVESTVEGPRLNFRAKSSCGDTQRNCTLIVMRFHKYHVHVHVVCL